MYENNWVLGELMEQTITKLEIEITIYKYIYYILRQEAFMDI